MLIFLSGNGPLVDVLQNALAIDRAEREGITKQKMLFEKRKPLFKLFINLEMML